MFKNSARRDQMISEQKKKLEELRLQTESQNTKLLKIQQKQREVQTEYQNKKRDMRETLNKLTVEAEAFMNKQITTTQQFEEQKEQIFGNDRKKSLYLKQKEELGERNEKRRDEIRQKEEKLTLKKLKLSEIRDKIKKHQIFQDFLKEVKQLSDDFNSREFEDFSAMSILEKYQTLKRKKEELSAIHTKYSLEKQQKITSTFQLKKERDERIMTYNAKIKDLKQEIDRITDENKALEGQLEGKLNENGERQRELGQIVFSIKGLHESIVGEGKGDRKILEMLERIKWERENLQEYYELFRSRVEEKGRG